MKIYLFGPISGNKNHREIFAEARTALRDMGHEVFCPVEFGVANEIKGLREAMRFDLAYILKEAEGLVGLPGWPASKGSLAKIHLAWAIGLPVYEYEFFARRILREVKSVPS